MTQTQSERRAYYDALLRDAIAEQIVARHAEIAVTRARPGSRSMGRSGILSGCSNGRTRRSARRSNRRTADQGGPAPDPDHARTI